MLVAVAAIVSAVVVGYFALTGSEDEATGSPTQMEHIHGLGVDPGDGTLYAGTHFGLFRMTENGEPVRVADRVQDFMGFTVAGPGRFSPAAIPVRTRRVPARSG
ncbi:MAG: hypothetical protein WKF79_16305 [Nocardioides sp.]